MGSREAVPSEGLEASTLRVLATPPVLKVSQLLELSRLPVGGYQAVHITGDVSPGAVARGEYALVVSGGVLGQSDGICRIDVEGELIVNGSLHHADVKARRILVGGTVSRSQLASETDIILCGDLLESRLKAGDKALMERDVEHLNQRIARARSEQVGLEQQLKLEQKRVDRLLAASRLSFDFNVGQIVRREADRLAIDLQPLYLIVGAKPEKEIDQALREFFAKAVVGLLTRANRPFIAQNEANRRVFAASVRKLYELLSLTREVDKRQATVTAEQQTLERCLETLGGYEARIAVRGKVAPEVTVEFEVMDAAVTRCAALVVRRGPSSSQLEIHRMDTRGTDSATRLAAEDLRDIEMLVEGGRVTWVPRAAESNGSP